MRCKASLHGGNNDGCRQVMAGLNTQNALAETGSGRNAVARGEHIPTPLSCPDDTLTRSPRTIVNFSGTHGHGRQRRGRYRAHRPLTSSALAQRPSPTARGLRQYRLYRASLSGIGRRPKYEWAAQVALVAQSHGEASSSRSLLDPPPVVSLEHLTATATDGDA